MGQSATENPREPPVYKLHSQSSMDPHKTLKTLKNDFKHTRKWSHDQLLVKCLLSGSIYFLVSNSDMVPLKSDFLIHSGGTDDSLWRSCYGILDWGLWAVGCIILGVSVDLLLPRITAVNVILVSTSTIILDAQKPERVKDKLPCARAILKQRRLFCSRSPRPE